MGHDHHHNTGNIRLAFLINLTFTVIEVIGGLLTNSMAIISDALHDLGDSLSLGLAWYFQKLSARGRDKNFSYGYRRFSLLGAIINAVILLIGSVFIIYHTLPRLLDPPNPDAQGMIGLAILGVIMNGVAVLKLKKGHSINERVIYLHLLEDVLGWVAVLIGAVVMYFYDVPVIDPILSLLISGFILFNVFTSLRKSFRIILQATPEDIEIRDLKQRIMELPEVEDVHDCHLWTMDGEYNIFTIHLVVHKDKTLEELGTMKTAIKQLLRDQKVDHVTIEFETKEEQCERSDV